MADTFIPWPGSSDEEEKDQYYPGALPSPDPNAMGALRDELYQEAEQLLGTDPRYKGLLPGPISAPSGGGAGVTEPTPEEPREFTPWPEDLAPVKQEDEPGYLSNKARILGERALGLTGSVIKGAGKAGEFLDEYFDTPQIVWGGGEGLRLMPREEFNKLRDAGVTENLITDTLPRAFQERDLGGEKTSSPEKIKEGWKNGDVGATAAAVGDFVLETGIESLADMAFAVWSLPLYVTGRTQELAEERVRGRRLSEALAEDPTLSAQAQQELATGFVDPQDVTAQEMATAAPFAALSSLLERIGAKGITEAGANITAKVAEEATEAGMKFVLKEGAKAGGKEAATEFFQEGVIEYFVENFNVSKEGLFADISIAEGAERGAFAALAGGGTGATLGTGAATLRSFAAPGSDQDTGAAPTPPPDGGQPSFEDTSGDGMSQAEREALGGELDEQEAAAQGKLDLPPQEGQAPTPTPEPTPTTPTPAEETSAPEVTPTEDEVVTDEDLVTEPTTEMVEEPAVPTEEPVTTEEPAPVETPMIQRKDVEEGFRKLDKRTKGGMPGIRKAIRELGTAIQAVFPDAKNLPSLKGTIGPKRIADYFATLDEEILIDETLPNLKGFLSEVLASPDAATAVQNINRLKDYVANSGAGVVQGETSPFLEQASRGITAYDTYEAERVSTKTKYTTIDKGKKSPTYGKRVERERITGPKNQLANRAVAVDELATVVTALTEKALELGLEVPAEVNETVRRARSWRESSQVAKPVVQKGGAGSTSTPQNFSGKNLDEVGNKLRGFAQTLIESIANVDVEPVKSAVDKPKTTKGKAKVEERSAVTEAPAKPKTETKGQKARKQAKKLKEASQKPAVKKGPSINQLRSRAKELGISAAGSKAALTERIAEVEANPEAAAKYLTKAGKEKARVKAQIEQGQKDLAAAVAGPKVTTAKEGRAAKAASRRRTATKKPDVKGAKPDKVLEVEPVPVTRGRGVTALVETMGFPAGTSLQEAFQAVGLSKKAAETLKGIVTAVPEAAQQKIFEAVQGYGGPEDNARVLAQITDAVGKEIPAPQMKDLVTFLEGFHLFSSGYDSQTEINEDQDLADQLARNEGYESAEEKAAYEDETGWGDVYEGDLNFDEIKSLVDTLHKEPNAKDRADLEAVGRALRPMFETLMHFKTYVDLTLEKGYGLNNDAAVPMNDLLEIIMDNLPTNSKFYTLAKQLRELDLQVPVHFFASSLQYGGPQTRAKYFWRAFAEDPMIAVTPVYGDMAGTVLSIFHEMVHAGTVIQYHAGGKLRVYTDELYRQALQKLPQNFSDPRWKLEATASVKAAIKAGIGTKESTEIIEDFLAAAQSDANPGTMKIQPRYFYGLTNPTEFLAEAHSNPQFQSYLAGNKVVLTKPLMRMRVPGGPRRPSNLMHALMNAIKRFVLKISPRNTILQDVMFLTAKQFTTRRQNDLYFRRAPPEMRADVFESAALMSEGQDGLKEAKKLRAQANIARSESLEELTPNEKESRNQTLDVVRDTKQGVAAQASTIVKETKNLGERGNLAISGRDAIERENRPLFDKAAAALGIDNPLTAYDRAKNRAQTLVRTYEKKAYELIKEYSKTAREIRNTVETLMRDITLGNIDPTQPLNSEANSHIWTKPTQTPKPKQRKDGTWYTPKAKKPKIRKAFRENAIKARDAWLKFSKENPKSAALLKRMAALTKQIHETKVSFAMIALGEAFEFNSADIKALGKARTDADIDAIIDPDEANNLNKQLEGSEDDLVGLTKEEKKDLKKKITLAEARAQAAKSAKTILRESSIKGWYFPLRRYGEYVVSTGGEVTGDDRYVSFHSTQKEAELVAEKINETITEEDNKVAVSLKLEGVSSPADVKSVTVDLKRRIKDPTTAARLDGALAEILAANASYQSQVKRMNVDGVAAKDMARGFEEYVHVSKYTLGDVRMAHSISKALSGIKQIAKGGPDTGLDGDEVIQAGRVQREIAKRNKSEGGERKKNWFQKKVGAIGFLNFLGAPSYWALNATQTYVVTIPYFAAKYGEAKGPASLFKAQGTVFKAVFAAMKSNDKSYEGFKKQLPPDARKLVEEMESDNLIQSTIAHEFGDMLDPRGFKRMRENAMLSPVAKVAEFAMTLMERVPEAIEHYNRISTGLAAYQLSNGSYTAVKDAVNQTQMNYDTNNRARLLKQLPGDTAGVTTGYVTPIMMFKTFGVGMLKLFYGAAFKAAVQKGGRQEGLKLAGYLMATHTLFGGVAGGIMVAPISAIIYALNSALEPDDEWKLEDAAAAAGQELAGDWGEIALERGLPAAIFGVDMSRSINLGNLIWMGDDRLDYTEYGDLKQGAFQVFGPVAQYAANTVTEGLRMVTGDPRGGLMDFAQAAVPVKAIRGTLQAIEYESEGLTTASELQLMSPDDFTAFLRTMSGFQATEKTTIRDQYYKDQRLESRRASRKSDLMVFANRAIRDGDWDQLAKIMEQIESYNLSVPEAKYRVTPGDMARLRSRRRTAQREYDKKYRYAD